VLAYSRLTALIVLPLMSAGCGTTAEKRLNAPVSANYSVRDPGFKASMGHLLGGNPISGNRAATLLNGDEIFPAMLRAIRSAKRTVTFETYVFWNGDVAREFTRALADRARAGVNVHVILDAHGASKAGRANLRTLRDAGVEVERYRSLSNFLGIHRYNNRTHRKLLVVDGRVGFIGGVGIADEWAGRAQSPEQWRDNHYRVEGPAVAQLQGIFVENWLKTRHQLLHGPDYFPQISPAGGLEVQAFSGAPREGSIDMSLMYQIAIAAARKSVRIENAYFVPDRALANALIDAAKRGVRVEIIVPGEHIDQKMVRHASRRSLRRLAAAGAQIYEFQPTMLHCKLLIVDDYFASVGSANFDNRSLRLNDEANMNVFDSGFARRQIAVFEADKRRSKLFENSQGPEAVTQLPSEVPAAAVSSQL
jgi:cardiolipin synthase